VALKAFKGGNITEHVVGVPVINHYEYNIPPRLYFFLPGGAILSSDLELAFVGKMQKCNFQKVE
jgi:hypothetical protein